MGPTAMGNTTAHLAQSHRAFQASTEDASGSRYLARDGADRGRRLPPISLRPLMSHPMRARRQHRNTHSQASTADAELPAQLVLPMDSNDGATREKRRVTQKSRATLTPTERPSLRQEPAQTASVVVPPVPCNEEMLHMRDLVRIYRRHRATIYRYIKLNIIPEQRRRNGRKIGWARSDIERSTQGDLPSAK